MHYGKQSIFVTQLLSIGIHRGKNLRLFAIILQKYAENFLIRQKIYFASIKVLKPRCNEQNVGTQKSSHSMHLDMELFSRRRWTTGSAQQSNNNGIMPCKCCIIFWGFNINITAFYLACSNIHLLVLKSSMTLLMIWLQWHDSISLISVHSVRSTLVRWLWTSISHG